MLTLRFIQPAGDTWSAALTPEHHLCLVASLWRGGCEVTGVWGAVFFSGCLRLFRLCVGQLFAALKKHLMDI